MKTQKQKLIGLFGAVAVFVAAFGAMLLPADEVSALEDVTCTGDAAGPKDCNVDVSNFGYGKYTIFIRGDGASGKTDSDAKVFYYYPAYAELVKEGDKYYLNVYYNWNAESAEAGEGNVASIVVTVHDPEGNEVKFSPMDIELNSNGVTKVELPFEDYGLIEGTYTIKVDAYNVDGVHLGFTYTFEVTYKLDELPVPDTGGLFQSNNISRTDYLVTGLVIFGIVAVAGVAFILRNDKKNANKTRRRK